jgi:FkbM family methyltransferase
MASTVLVNVPGGEPIELLRFYEHLVKYYLDCEPQTKAWFQQHVEKDWVLFDCGANIGYYTILFARQAPQGKVFAFEPTDTIDMLKENLAFNGLSASNVKVLQLAVGNTVGRKEDAVFRIWGEKPDVMEYDFTTIDHFAAQNEIDRLNAIKIDVDSFDFDVLQGAAGVMAGFNPFVMVELNHALGERGQSVADALHWMSTIGYSTCTIFDGENYLFKRGYRHPRRVNISSLLAK